MSDDYEKLKKKWYAKLAKTKDKNGETFEDIEKNEYDFKPHQSSAIFTRTSGRSQSSLTPVAMEAKRDYYIMAEHFLNEHEFESRIERIIWEYHSNAISIRDIVKILNKVNSKRAYGNKIYRDRVWNIINKLEALMFKKYLVQGE
jgi:hypothetical protein